MSFLPIADGSVKIAATTSSGNVSLGTLDISVKDVLVTNLGTTTAFVKLGVSGVTAGTDNDVPIPAGQSRMLNREKATHAAAIMSSLTGDVWFTLGVGHAL